MFDYSNSITTCIASKKEAERLMEILAQRLRQTVGVYSIQDARACLIIGSDRETGVTKRETVWYKIDLNPSRPVEKLDISKKEMAEFLSGVVKGEKIAKKAAKDAALLALGSKGKLNKLLAGKKKRSRKA